jgi:hypothetical protein
VLLIRANIAIAKNTIANIRVLPNGFHEMNDSPVGGSMSAIGIYRQLSSAIDRKHEQRQRQVVCSVARKACPHRAGVNTYSTEQDGDW